MRLSPTYLVLAGITSLACSQTPSATRTPALTAGTQLVVVDVTVQDREGHPVHGLKPTDFKVSENKSTQTIKTFEEQAAANPDRAKVLPPLKLPPGVFTDFTPVPENGALNILLLDELNTPMKDQSFVRDQLRRYIRQANPGTRLAIFGLSTHLVMLQGFTSDPEILKTITDRKLIPRASVLLDDPVGSNTDPTSLADTMSAIGANAEAVANMQQFEADTSSFQTQLRTRYTLDAFNQLARYLQTLPGRKNLLWFSGSFPLAIFPDSSLDNPFSVASDASSELSDTTALLDRARVAVYPIDARGLQTTPMLDASRSGSAYVRNPGKLATDISKFMETNAQEHMTMDQIAQDTGGHAFYNTNGLADAVAKSIDAGSNFYTVTYTPTNHDWKGEYRKIRVELVGADAGRGLVLAYRHGYIANDPNSHRTAAMQPATQPASTVAQPFSYDRAAMQRGAPTPSEVLFKVSVLPDSNATTDTINPKNHPSPTNPMHGPFRPYDVAFAVVGSNLSLTPQPDGRRSGMVEFLTYVYDVNGKLLNIEGESVSMNVTPENYARLLKTGLGFELQVSTPAHQDCFLRIAVHDVPSGRYGVVEVPTEMVAHLPPPPDAPPAPPASPTPPQGPPPASK